jgi:hypothetical protein
VTIGNVRPNTTVLVTIQYVGELKHDAEIDGLRYMLPTSIATRYGCYPGEPKTVNVNDQKGMSITVDIDMAKSAIRTMQSPTHPVAMSMGALSSESSRSPFQPSKGLITLTRGTTELDGDFVLQILIDDISRPQAIIEKHPTLNSRAIMTTMAPKFNLPLSSPEIVFIADQSGSMSGSKNTNLIAALQVFLKSLPFGVRFNICAFGSHYTMLFESSRAYNEENLHQAIRFVQGFNAQYGGTEMLEPFKEVFERRLGDLPLEIMLLTDGEIWGESGLFDYINQEIHEKKVDARVFTFGIGNDVSHTLVEGVARAGNGFAQFVSDEQLDAKVLRMLRASLYPHIKDCEFQVNFDERDIFNDDDDFEIVEKIKDCLVIDDSETEAASAAPTASTSFFDKSAVNDTPIQSDISGNKYSHLPSIAIPKIFQAPSVVPPLCPHNRTTLYIILGAQAPQKRAVSVTLRARALTGPIELTIPLSESTVSAPTVHQLAARRAVQELEEGKGWLHKAKTQQGELVKAKHKTRFDEMVECEAARLGETFQVAGKWCFFVAVQDNGDQMDVGNDERQPSALTPTARSLPPRYSMVAASYAPAPQIQNTTFKMAKKKSAMNSGVVHRKRVMSREVRLSQPPAPSSPPGAYSPVSPTSTSTTPTSPYSSALNIYGMQQPIQFQAQQQVPLQLNSLEDATAPTADYSLDFSTSMAANMDFGTSLLSTESEEFYPVWDGIQIPAQTSSPAEIVRAIIALQNFAGSWKAGEELLRIVGVDIVRLSELQSDPKKMTTIVVEFLEKNMQAESAMWEIVVEKAKLWIEAQG